MTKFEISKEAGIYTSCSKSSRQLLMGRGTLVSQFVVDLETIEIDI